MDVTMELRPATAAEVPTVLELLRLANEEHRAALPPAGYAKYLAMVLDVHGRHPFSELWVATDGAAVVATATFYPDASREGWNLPAGYAGIRAMAVHPDARGRGAGSALLSECVRRAESEGAPAIALHTAPFMTGAMALYERAGFVRCPDYDAPADVLMGTATRDEVPFTAVTYVRWL